MTLTLNRIKPRNFLLTALLLYFLFPVQSFAQNSLSLSVTPPLFQLSAVPGQSWQSSVKIINTNNFPLVVYADPVNFAPIGEEGQGRFLPVLEAETQGQTLAEWISVSREPIEVAPETSLDIPFSVVIPENPPPGGHFAALLVGTRPPESDGLVVSTAQMVSSLIFLRISGEVNESGRVREFSVGKSFIETPEVDFQLRFENSGNVHLRPQGDIVIYNMWGKERGMVPINQSSNFGNVLPSTTRKFDFTWKGESAISDMGRYKAVVTLTYGDEVRQNVSQAVYFWVIPVKAALGVLFAFIVLFIAARWAIKSYVRHMLHMAGIDPDEHARRRRAGDVAMLRRLPNQVKEDLDGAPVSGFWRRHMYLLVGIPSIMLIIGGLLWYVAGALTAQRSYEVTVDTGAGQESLNSEELRLQELQGVQETNESDMSGAEQGFVLHVVNVSGDPGAAAELAIRLAKEGYYVSSVEPDLDREQSRTAIVTTPEGVMGAKNISSLMNNALVSVVEDESPSDVPEITIFVGRDLATD